MSSASPPSYVLGTHARELDRLGFQHRVWSNAAHTLWERAGLVRGARVLDVGCGPGFASFDLAQLVGVDGLVVGLDESGAFIEHAQGQARSRGLAQARFVVGDATDIGAGLDSLDLGGARFDLAYCRWVLCFVSDPRAVLASIRDVLAPGAALCVQDYMEYGTMAFAPEVPSFAPIVGALGDAIRSFGGDPDVMRRLPGLAREVGFEVAFLDRIQTPPARPGRLMWSWPATFWDVFLPRLVELGGVTQGQVDDFMHDWGEISGNPSAIMHLPPVYEMIARLQ